MSRVAGKVVLVTGAGSGIGRAAAKLLADEGATVIVDRHQPAGRPGNGAAGRRRSSLPAARHRAGSRLEAGHRRYPGARGPAGWPGEQCRHRGAISLDLRERDGRAVAAHPVDQRPGRVPGLQAWRAGDARVGRRLDRQSLVARGLPRHAGSCGLRRQQGRGAAVHQDRGHRLRPQGLQGALQFGASRRHPDADGRGHPAQRQGQGTDAQAHSDRRIRRAARTSPMASST